MMFWAVSLSIPVVFASHSAHFSIPFPIACIPCCTHGSCEAVFIPIAAGAFARLKAVLDIQAGIADRFADND